MLALPLKRTEPFPPIFRDLPNWYRFEKEEHRHIHALRKSEPTPVVFELASWTWCSQTASWTTKTQTIRLHVLYKERNNEKRKEFTNAFWMTELMQEERVATCLLTNDFAPWLGLRYRRKKGTQTNCWQPQRQTIKSNSISIEKSTWQTTLEVWNPIINITIRRSWAPMKSKKWKSLYQKWIIVM